MKKKPNKLNIKSLKINTFFFFLINKLTTIHEFIYLYIQSHGRRNWAIRSQKNSPIISLAEIVIPLHCLGISCTIVFYKIKSLLWQFFFVTVFFIERSWEVLKMKKSVINSNSHLIQKNRDFLVATMAPTHLNLPT